MSGSDVTQSAGAQSARTQSVATQSGATRSGATRPTRGRTSSRLILAALILASVPAAPQTPGPAAPRYADGAATFQANCAVCHGPAGAGQPSLAPPLTSYPVRYATIPEGRRQLAMTVLYGMFGDVVVEQKHYNFKMPDFTKLSDEALAALLNYVVFDLAHAPDDTKPLTATEIAAERAHPVEGAAVREHRAAVLTALGL